MQPDLEDAYLAQIRKVMHSSIPSSDYSLFIFGSRARAEAKTFSDIDIGILGPEPISFSLKVEIEDALSETSIPYLMDVVDFARATEPFRSSALRYTISL